MKRWLLKIWRWLPLSHRGRWLLTRILMKKFLVGTLAIIFDDQQRLLVVCHTYRKAYPWGLPGGWLKAGELASAAIEREILEETGFRVRTLRPLIIGGDEVFPRVDLVFHCELLSGTFRPCEEVSEARFCALDELPDLEPYDQRLVDQAVDLLSG